MQEVLSRLGRYDACLDESVDFMSKRVKDEAEAARRVRQVWGFVEAQCAQYATQGR
jgi:hypothetical protein